VKVDWQWIKFTYSNTGNNQAYFFGSTCITIDEVRFAATLCYMV